MTFFSFAAFYLSCSFQLGNKHVSVLQEQLHTCKASNTPENQPGPPGSMSHPREMDTISSAASGMPGLIAGSGQGRSTPTRGSARQQHLSPPGSVMAPTYSCMSVPSQDSAQNANSQGACRNKKYEQIVSHNLCVWRLQA